MLGDGAVAVRPDDERYKHLIGKLVRLPLADRLIPVIADEYPDPEKGSGAVKITAAHDFNDFEVWQRHREQDYFKRQLNGGLINLFTPEAKMNENCPPQYRGLDRYEARKRIVADLEALGLVDKIENITHAVPHGDRSNVVIEPYLTEQWYVNAHELAKPAIAAVREGKTKFVPENWENTYFNWMENIQPWCISRQLWWGHQIPAWYGPDENIFRGRERSRSAGAGRQALRQAGEAQARRGRARHLVLLRAVAVLDLRLAGKDAGACALLSDQRAGHRLRHHLLLGRAHDDDGPSLHEGHSRSTTSTSTAWCATRPAPRCRSRRATWSIRSASSTSTAPTRLRFTLARNGSPGHDIRLGPQDVENNRNFRDQAVERRALRRDATSANTVPASIRGRQSETLNRWIAHETAKAAAEITRAIEDLQLQRCRRRRLPLCLERLLRLVRRAGQAAADRRRTSAAKDETRAMAAWARDEILKLLHPFMPFVTEELWGVSGQRDALLALERWPSLDSRICGSDDERRGRNRLGHRPCVNAIRSVRAEIEQ